jgi:cysteine desulfurase / selenocysteine lyase
MIASLAERAHYPALAERIYLNQASLGLIAQPAVGAMHAFLENVARHGNIYMTDSGGNAVLRCTPRLRR